MTDTPDTKTINDMVVILRLHSGETLIGLCSGMNDDAVQLSFPFSIVELEGIDDQGDTLRYPVYRKFCPYVRTRHFVFPSYDITFCKDASEKYAETFIKNAMLLDKDEFAEYIEKLKWNSEVGFDSIEKMEEAMTVMENGLNDSSDLYYNFAPHKTLQ